MPEVTNLQRAAWAEVALAAFASECGMEWEADQTRLCDLLADLMHYCAVHAKREDSPMDFDRALASARMHFEAEQKEEEA
jgi:uncharacterized protein with von Willebrand factor type A (vWA) domain